MGSDINGAAREVTGAPEPGMVVCADWAGGDNAKMRLLERHQHATGDFWSVNVYSRQAGRYSKTVQHVSEDSIRAAIAKARQGGGA